MNKALLCAFFLQLALTTAIADVNLNFNFAGMIPTHPAAPVQPQDEPTCPSPTPHVCPAVTGLHHCECDCEEMEVEDYFTYDTSIPADQIEPERFGIYRADGEAQEHERHRRGPIAGCQAPISYFGGPVMSGRNVVYFIYYGAFSSFHPNGTNTATNRTKSLMTQFVSNLSNHPWFNITTEYYSRMAAIVGKVWVWQTNYVPSTITYGGAFSVNTPYKYATWNATWGKWFIDSGGVAQAIQDAVGGPSRISNDGVYMFIPSSDVYTEGSCGYGVPNFQGAYCAYHTFQVVNSTTAFKYSFISNPANNTNDYCTKFCSHEAYFGLGSKVYPNERAADTMISLIAHELVETLTDPVWAPVARSAWLDQVGCENADMCAWTYGATNTSTNGGKTNLSLGGRQWLVQQNWVISKNDCGMSL